VRARAGARRSAASARGRAVRDGGRRSACDARPQSERGAGPQAAVCAPRAAVGGLREGERDGALAHARRDGGAAAPGAWAGLGGDGSPGPGAPSPLREPRAPRWDRRPVH